MHTRHIEAYLLAAFITVASGCATPQPPSTGRAKIDTVLTEPCQPLNQLADGTGATVLRWILETADAYNDCAGKHRRLVEAIR